MIEHNIKFYFIAWLVLSFFSCATMAPTTKGIQVNLEPVPIGGDEAFTIDNDGYAVYDLKGLKIAIKAMTGEQLNKAFPDISFKGKASTNPYTYGDWKDPELGYVPNRFTVFVVQVVNRTFPKVNLDPRKAVLVSDRGDKLYSYGRDAKDNAPNNFDEYYLQLRGASGVDKARYEERMGIVRQTLYIDGQVFKGDKKEGMLVFDPLHPSVKSVELILKDFVLEYDANNWPVKLQDFRFKFARKASQESK